METRPGTAQGQDSGDEHYQIIGGEAQTLQLILQPGEDVVADASNFCYASDNVVFEHGGLDFSAWLQGIAGGPTPFKSLFYNSHESRTAFIGFAHPQGGEILKLAIRPTTPVNVFKGCFLCARENVGVQYRPLPFEQPLYFDSPAACCYCAGDGEVFIQTGGVILQKRLRENESLFFDLSCIAACDSTCRFRLQSPGNVTATLFGLKRAMVRVYGPGNVYFSTHTIQRTAGAVRNLSLGGSYGGTGLPMRLLLMLSMLAFMIALATTRIIVELEHEERD